MRKRKLAVEIGCGCVHPGLDPALALPVDVFDGGGRLFVGLAVSATERDGAKGIPGSRDGSAERSALPLCAGGEGQAGRSPGEGGPPGEGVGHALPQGGRVSLRVVVFGGGDGVERRPPAEVFALAIELLESNVSRILAEESMAHICWNFELCREQREREGEREERLCVYKCFVGWLGGVVACMLFVVACITYVV